MSRPGAPPRINCGRVRFLEFTVTRRLISIIIFVSAFSAAFAEDRPLWLRFPAISPDGGTIAFGYQGNLYRVNTGGVADLRQLFTRPVARLNPYTTPNPRLYICSASSPPGGGVHGMCGYHAARAALARVLR